MLKTKKLLKSFIITPILVSVLIGINIRTTHTVQAAGNPITMAGFGHRQVQGGTEGDTWDSTWLANNNVYLQNNDGYGWGSGNTGRHDCISQLNGTPETPLSISGSNLNPGTIGNFLGGTYSTGTYEVDGVLYHNVCYSQQVPGAWVFHHTSIIKSTDGGATWTNHLGQTNTLPPDSATSSMFPDDRISDVDFVKYGQGGTSPNIDNAQTYVYLFAPSKCPGDDYYMCRIKRTDLPSLDKSKIQYYTGGDGMSDSNWSIDSSKAASIYHAVGQCLPGGMVYNYGLQRYILTPANSDSWASPTVDSTLYILEAPQPWGPWTKVTEENVNNKEGDNLTWIYPMQKITSQGGQKMWMTASGRNPYGLQFMPAYLTTQPVQTYEAENSILSGGTSTTTSKAGYSGSGYATGFTSVGSKSQFNVNATTAGAYIMKIRYNTNAYQSINCYVNGSMIQTLKLGKSEQVYNTWTDMTIFAWLQSGNNTVTFQYDTGNTGNLNLDKLSLALYSTTSGSLPNCYPPLTQSPYGNNGDNWSLPGQIEAENYDNGGEGIAYHDADTLNQGGQYRSDGVDIESCSDTGGGYDICWAQNGEWLEYTTNITTGIYNITARIASQSNINAQLIVKLDGVILGTTNIPATGGWQSWQDVALNNINVAGGNGKVLRLEIVNGGFNLNSIKFTNVSTNTEINDNDPSIQYSSGWTYQSTSGYYNNDNHYSNTVGSNVQFTFTGTGIKWIGAKNTDHGQADIYIDGVWQATVDTTAATYLKQQELYTNLSLSNASHTIKIQIKTSGYQDIDAFIYTH